MAPKLVISNLGKSFGDLHALQGIDFAIDRGEFISLVGPSGCGKTTFLRIVAGLEAATSGECGSTAVRCMRPAPTAASCSRTTACCPGAPCSPTPSSGARWRARSARPSGNARCSSSSWSGSRLRALPSAPAVGRHAPARQPRPRARDRSGNPADGRAILLARRADPRDHADRADAHLGRGRKTVLFVTHQIDEAVFLSRPRAGVRAPSRRLRETVAIDLPRARASRSSARPNSCATSTTSGG